MAENDKTLHPAVTSPLFQLVATYECDIDIGSDQYPCRIEIFQEKHRKNFRGHIWEIERFRMTPRFPESPSGEPLHKSDELVLLERSGSLSGEYMSFAADTAEEALQLILQDLIRKLKEWTEKE